MPVPTQVFISYAGADEALREELERHLALLHRQGVIDAWHDGLITPGEDRKGAIDEHLARAKVVLLLVSADFLASDYYDVEMMRALARPDAIVIPIILRACDLKGAPFEALPALPRDGKAVSSWSNRDEAWTDV